MNAPSRALCRAVDVEHRQGVGHRWNVRGVQLVELIEVADDGRQFGGQPGDLHVAQLEPGEHGYVADQVVVNLRCQRKLMTRQLRVREAHSVQDAC